MGCYALIREFSEGNPQLSLRGALQWNPSQREGRNDMKTSESHVSTSKVSFLNLDSRIRVILTVLTDDLFFAIM